MAADCFQETAKSQHGRLLRCAMPAPFQQTTLFKTEEVWTEGESVKRMMSSDPEFMHGAIFTSPDVAASAFKL